VEQEAHLKKLLRSRKISLLANSVFYTAHSSLSASLDSFEKPISTVENVYEEACSIPPDTPVPTYEQAMESTYDVPSLPPTSL
jgi:hypothetical protein